MPESVIAFDGVWKKFRRGEHHDSLRDLVPALVRRFTSRREPELDADEFWVLRNVSFEITPGQALGIIGPNGAGKSTALKVLTRILKPTRGTARVQGRVGALIELAGISPGSHGSREHLPPGRDHGHAAGGHPQAVRRDHRVRRHPRFHRHAGQALFERDECEARVRDCRAPGP